MTPLILAVLAIVSIAAAGFALVPSMLGSSRAETRRRAFQGDINANRRENYAEKNRDARRKSVQQVLKTQTAALEKSKRRVPLQTQLFQAGMSVKKEAFIRNSAILGVALFIACFLLQVPLVFAAVFGIAGAYLVPKFYVARRRKKYCNLYLDELPNAVEAIVRGVKTGLPLNDSMRIVAKEAREPVRSEFQRVIDQQAIGKTMQEAVQVLYDRVPMPEVNFFIVVITVQQQAGGNLSEALGNLSRVLRNRKKMKHKVKAMSSEAKSSAMIIGSLPFIMAGLISIATPGYLTPLVSSNIGFFWLGVSALLMSTGIFIMNRMIQFDF
jgi:tight adherence protein B